MSPWLSLLQEQAPTRGTGYPGRLLIAACRVLRPRQPADEACGVLLVTALVLGGVVGKAVLAAAVLLGPAIGRLVRLIVLQLVAGAQEVKADAAVGVRFVAVQRVAATDDLDPGPAVALATVASGGIVRNRVVAAVDQDPVEGVVVHPSVAGHGVAGAVDLDPVTAVALNVADAHGVPGGRGPDLHAVAGVPGKCAAGLQVVGVASDPDPDGAAAHRVDADAVAVPQDQDAVLRRPRGPDGLNGMAVRREPPSHRAAHGVRADDRQRPGAGNVPHRLAVALRRDLGDRALGDGQRLGAAER